MTITLKIDNCDALPDGGPLFYSISNAGFDFGRESHLDWTLPDESRYISGRHCEIRFERGQYYLYDISRNGTFVNGSQDRVKSPHQLQNGDKLSVGHYIIVISIEGVEALLPQEDIHGAAEQIHASDSEDIWSVGEDVPAPISRRDLMPPKQQGQQAADFSQQYLDIPQMTPDEDYLAATGAPSPFATPASQSPLAEGQPSAPAFTPTPQPSSPYVDSQPNQVEGGHQSGVPGAVSPVDQGHSPFQESAANESFATPVALAAAPVSAAVASGGNDKILQQIAAGAGISVESFGAGDPSETAFEIGAVLRVGVEQMAQLLKARAAAKTMAKSSKRTMISAMENNPLKFVPTTEEMFEIMFARRKAGYLGARESFENGFEDLKIHEFATYSAMQRALARLLEDFSPESIEDKLPSSTFSSKSSKAWDAYVTRWEAMSEPPNENGALDVFLKHFADAYDEASKSKKGG
jgi:type VI secretion system protein ImpI